MSRHAVTINDDGTLRWHGVDAGKTKVLAMNVKKKLIVIHSAGGYWWDNGGKHYGAAKINVHEYEEGPSPREIFLTELFGVLDYKPRGGEPWRPKQ